MCTLMVETRPRHLTTACVVYELQNGPMLSRLFWPTSSPGTWQTLLSALGTVPGLHAVHTACLPPGDTSLVPHWMHVFPDTPSPFLQSSDGVGKMAGHHEGKVSTAAGGAEGKKTASQLGLKALK